MDLTPGIGFFLQQCGKLLLSLGSHFSLSSLAAAVVFGGGFFAYRRLRRNRKVRLRTIWRALFPRKLTTHRSNRADLAYLFFNVFLFGIVLGWAVLQYQFLSNAIIAGLVNAFGATTPSRLPSWFSNSVITVMLFLAYEIGYWLNHWLSHRVPFMWEFHKVHHSAEVLTPLTNFRVHPIYALIFANILAITASIANGLGNYMFGDTAYQYALSDTNIILVLFIHTYVHLQHTHIWIPFTGFFGRLFVSPAHHQVHHSTNPKHFNRNFGSCLAVWDWMFGTLYVPGKERERLSFGLDEAEHAHPHTLFGELVEPLVRVFWLLALKLKGSASGIAAETIPPR